MLTHPLLNQLQQLGSHGIRQLIQLQKATLEARADLKRLFPLLK